MLPVSLDCPFLIALWLSLTCICSVSCVPNVASVSGLSILDCPLVISNVYLFCVLCTQCCQCLWIVHSWLPFGYLKRVFVLCLVYPMLPVSLDCPFLVALWLSLTSICSVFYVPNVASVSGLSILDCPLVISNEYLFCVLCTQYCQCLWIVHSWLPFGYL